MRISYNDETPDWAGGRYPDCPECGETMGFNCHLDEFKCPRCGYKMSSDEWAIEDDSEIPFGCRACGGPYPECTAWCNLFDN